MLRKMRKSVERFRPLNGLEEKEREAQEAENVKEDGVQCVNQVRGAAHVLQLLKLISRSGVHNPSAQSTRNVPVFVLEMYAPLLSYMYDSHPPKLRKARYRFACGQTMT